MMISTICLFAVLIAITVYFIVWDIKCRMIPNLHVYICLGIAVPFVIMEWAFNYIPNYGLITIFWAIIGLIIPFVWYYFMRNYIGEQDVKWLALIFVALPFCLLPLIALLIVFILITFAVFKLRKSNEMLPAMLPIGLSLLTEMVFLFV